MYKYLIALLVAALLLSSCKSWFSSAEAGNVNQTDH
jgi:hypothetical protein